jgi:hypothetical protein
MAANPERDVRAILEAAILAKISRNTSTFSKGLPAAFLAGIVFGSPQKAGSRCSSTTSRSG